MLNGPITACGQLVSVDEIVMIGIAHRGGLPETVAMRAQKRSEISVPTRDLGAQIVAASDQVEAAASEMHAQITATGQDAQVRPAIDAR